MSNYHLVIIGKRPFIGKKGVEAETVGLKAQRQVMSLRSL